MYKPKPSAAKQRLLRMADWFDAYRRDHPDSLYEEFLRALRTGWKPPAARRPRKVTG